MHPVLPNADTSVLATIRSFVSRPSRCASAVLLAAALAGCAHQPTEVERMARYDLGAPALHDAAPDGVQVSPLGAMSAPPALKVLVVSAPAALDNDRMVYRLIYADPHEIYRYVHSRWTSTPAQLMTYRLRARMAREVRVLDGGDPDQAPMLKVELLDFSQRFDAPRRGQGTVVLRASLKLSNGTLIGQRDFSASAPCATPDAAGGAGAISAATNMALGELEDWVAQRAWVMPPPPIVMPSASTLPAAPPMPASAATPSRHKRTRTSGSGGY